MLHVSLGAMSSGGEHPRLTILRHHVSLATPIASIIIRCISSAPARIFKKAQTLLLSLGSTSNLLAPEGWMANVR
jgi:hypothetical protein